MRNTEEQIKGLKKVGELVEQRECNCAIFSDPGDVPYLMAIDTPRASQIVFAVDGYDVWRWGPKHYDFQAADLSAEDAAKIVIIEYLTAKAVRIKTFLYPHLSIEKIMKNLERGYQRKKAKSDA